MHAHFHAINSIIYELIFLLYGGGNVWYGDVVYGVRIYADLLKQGQCLVEDAV